MKKIISDITPFRPKTIQMKLFLWSVQEVKFLLLKFH